jgi:hypothetical protein
MRPTRRENISAVPGHRIWRHGAQLMLTPRAMRSQMKIDKCLRLTKFDEMLTDDQTSALERWALNEQALRGKPKTQSWGDGGGGSGGDCSPLPDAWMHRLKMHGRIKAALDVSTTEILMAFTEIQNREPGALSTAQYGLIFCPTARNKNDAFAALVRDAGSELVTRRY